MKINLLSHQADELTEIVFANRHKSYGAYTLRRDYNQRVNQSLLATVTGLGLLFFLALTFSNQKITDITIDTDETVIYDAGIEPVKPKVLPQETKPPSPPQQSKEFTSNVLITDTTNSDLDIDSTTNNSNMRGDSASNQNQKQGITGTGIKKDTTQQVDNSVTLFAEVMPEFSGGENALMKYLSKHIDCRLWKESGESGNVVFSFVVGKDGSVSDVEILRDGVGYGCADQAMYVIRNMPKWKPGIQGKRPVNVKYILPVSYVKE